jgi:ATP-binding cassette subfamily F protein 3
MMFEDDAALKKIGVLSGGEKSRVMLGKLLVKPVNLLLLDEPTNHLDMESNDALLAALDNFDGILIMVTHNEMFLHALAKRLIVFKENGASLFEGSYSEFLQKEGWEGEEEEMEPAADEKNEKCSSAVVSKKDFRKMRTEILSERSGVLKPLEKRIREIENRIEEHENELGVLSQSMQEATVDGDGKKINELSRSIYSRQTDVDHLFEELESVTETLDAKRKEYEKKLKSLENIREN